MSIKKAGLVILSIILLFNSLILINSEIPKATNKYVNDFANILTEPEKAYLQTLLFEVDQNTTAEVVIVTIESLQGEDISKYTVDLASEWKVGKADKDNGLVILYAKQENKIFAATGYGLEGILPDSKVGRLLDEYYVPLRDQNKSKEGIIEFTNNIVQVINENKEEVLSGNAGSKNDNTIVFIILGLIIFIFIIFIIKKNNQKEKISKKHTKDSKMSKPRKFLLISGNIIWVICFIIYFITGFFLWFIIAIILMIILRALLTPAYRSTGFWLIPGPSSSSSGFGGGGFSGGFSGGGFSGGGAGR